MKTRIMNTKNAVLIRIINCILVTCCALVIVVVLATKSKNEAERYLEFNRLVISYAKLENFGIKDTQVVAISGISKNSIYFQTKDPNNLIKTDKSLKAKKTVVLNFPKHNYSAFSCLTDSPYVFLFAGNFPGVFVSDFKNEMLVNKYQHSSVYTRAIALSNNSFVFRGFDNILSKRDQIFIKVNTLGSLPIYSDSVLKKRNDGGISTDGQLLYDTHTASIIYVPFYQDMFIRFDTSLHHTYTKSVSGSDKPLYSGIGTDVLNSTLTNVAPKNKINSYACVSEGKLYIKSNLKTSKESDNLLSSNSVVDIYNISNGNYIESIFIPAYRDEKMTSFRVDGDMFVVVYKNYVATYSIHKK